MIPPTPRTAPPSWFFFPARLGGATTRNTVGRISPNPRGRKGVNAKSPPALISLSLAYSGLGPTTGGVVRRPGADFRLRRCSSAGLVSAENPFQVGPRPEGHVARYCPRPAVRPFRAGFEVRGACPARSGSGRSRPAARLAAPIRPQPLGGVGKTFGGEREVYPRLRVASR